MRRVLLHICFWIAYLCQDVLLVVLLNASSTPEPAVGPRLLVAIAHCGVVLVPKLLFTYFMLYYVLDRLIGEGIQIKKIFYSLLALGASMALYRALMIYFVNPVIYGWPSGSTPYFDLLSFIVILIDIGFVSGIAIAIKQVRLQLAARETEKNLVKEKLETELKFLRNQTNPHFLFNTLNNIYALTRKKSDEAPEVVMKLSRLLRFMLYETQKPFITIAEEIQMLDHYIELEKIRYDGRLSVEFRREIDDRGEPMSPLLLLPFIENAFKHGISESRFRSYIHINMNLKNSILTFEVENSKEDGETSHRGENIGLNNVRRQLELTYKGYDMQVHNESSLFRVNLTLNLKSHAKI